MMDVKIVFVYVSVYYDYPLSGIGDLNGERVMFKLASDWGHKPVYDIYRFDDPRVEENHRLFEEYVGTQWCRHIPKAERKRTGRKDWHDFYNLRGKWAELPDNAELIGQVDGFMRSLCED